MYVGVDLGGAKGSTTGVALLKESRGRPTVFRLESPVGDAALLRAMLSHGRKLEVVAIDAPLTLPPCLRCGMDECPGVEECDDPYAGSLESPYTQRHTEAWIKRELGIRPMPTMVLGMITSRGIHVTKRLRSSGVRDVIEVYPKATLYSLARSEAFGGKRFASAIKGYKRKRADISHIRYLTVKLSAHLDFGDWLESCWEDHNLFDAVISGYTAYLFSKRKTLLAVDDGMEADGAIVIPDWKRL